MSGRVATCAGRLPADGNIANYGLQGEGGTPVQEANGQIMSCLGQEHKCQAGYTFSGWCSGNAVCADNVRQRGRCPGRQERAICARNWEAVMTDQRKDECCNGTKTTAFDCRADFCPNSQACFTHFSGKCADPAHVESKGCERFCDENPALCAGAIRAKCVGDRVASEFCRTRCKTVDCTNAYKEYCNKPENKDKGFCKCFLTAEFDAFEKQMKTLYGPNTTVRPQCGFAGCAGNRESTDLLIPTPTGTVRNTDCPAQCNQVINADIKDSDIKWAEIINHCVIGKDAPTVPPTPLTPAQQKARDDALEAARRAALANRPPGQNIDDLTNEELMELAEEEAAKRARKKWIIIGAAAAVGALLLILVLVMVSRSRKRKAAAAAEAAV